MGHPPGERLFAQYAHAPNALGYCGPQGAGGLAAVAGGLDVDFDVRAAARGFSGAWPYQQILGRLAGVDDPLDERVVRGYWTGNELTSAVTQEDFGQALFEWIRPQAGHYWSHLTSDLRAEAAPTHAFHVLGVYPWSRMLSSGQPEPLDVLENCRIGWGDVEEIHPDGWLTVTGSNLLYSEESRELSLSPPISRRVESAGFVDALSAGDTVALHWGRVCDRLSPDQTHALEHWTKWQLEATNPRLRAEPG